MSNTNQISMAAPDRGISMAALVERIIIDGCAEVRMVYAAPDEHHKRDGAIEGFEACRGKSPDDLVELWQATEAEAGAIRGMSTAQPDFAKTYWRHRYKAMQIEFVLNVLSVGLGRPLLAHLPTARGALKYAAIVGVREELLA